LVEQLAENANKYLSDEALAKYSPKMLQLYNNIMEGEGSMRLADGPSPDPLPTRKEEQQEKAIE